MDKFIFDEDGYTYVENLLSKEECKQLTKEMFDASTNSNTFCNDAFCPISLSTYCFPPFDKYIEGIKTKLENAVGKELRYIYNYSRIYAKGEDLERHRDRAECEISVTLTLGHPDGCEPWSIYVSQDVTDPFDDECKIAIGDGIIYRGSEIPHYRNALEDDWQTQLFIHFVDVNGPYSYITREQELINYQEGMK